MKLRGRSHITHATKNFPQRAMPRICVMSRTQCAHSLCLTSHFIKHISNSFTHYLKIALSVQTSLQSTEDLKLARAAFRHAKVDQQPRTPLPEFSRRSASCPHDSSPKTLNSKLCVLILEKVLEPGFDARHQLVHTRSSERHPAPCVPCPDRRATRGVQREPCDGGEARRLN